MKIEKNESEVVAEFEDQKVRYNKDDWFEEGNFLTEEGAVKLEEWKIDLVKNHGVDLDELRS